MDVKAEIMDQKSMQRAITRISFEIVERNKGSEDIYIIGILTRGTHLASRIAKSICQIENRQIDIGYIDIGRFRDDIPNNAERPDRSELPVPVADKRIILVDDVIFTGRTARAAIDAVLYRGRPKSIQLAALIDRGHRELPIRPDYIGKNVPTSRSEFVKVMMLEHDGQDKVQLAVDN